MYSLIHVQFFTDLSPICYGHCPLIIWLTYPSANPFGSSCAICLLPFAKNSPGNSEFPNLSVNQQKQNNAQKMRLVLLDERKRMDEIGKQFDETWREKFGS
jgi:hypothetical protein